MAVKEEIKKLYIPTIGIETHVQLKTKTKLFAAVGNDARIAAPNTLISHICVGLPGALPVLNEAAIELCAKAAFALGTKPQKYSKFDRKHYFYPDLPKGYQITHLEEDAGKNTHPDGADYSLVDLNRAGTPLLEIVSEPEIHSAAEAKAYTHELYLLMKYAGVSDVDLYHGNMRFDVNVSVGKDPGKPGVRTETKNLNSFKSVEKSVLYEIERQIELLEKGGKVTQETRGWDEAKQKTTSQRGKEETHDYRYFPDPDLPPVELNDEYINRIKKSLPLLPGEIRGQLKQLKIDKKVIEDILDNESIVAPILKAIDKTEPQNARRVAFDLLENPELKVKLEDHIKIAEMVNAKKLSSSAATQALTDLQKGASLEDATHSRLQVSDEKEIEKIVAEVLAENKKAATDVKNGEMKAIGFLVGQVMKKSKGKANPQMAQELIKKQLDSL
jgi:aspartyl-tRNA(Asn)/glutamyl-tRNA(Gln) amidotransferase subunit B